MSDLISYFRTSDNAFWGDNVYRWWFYFSLIVIIVTEKRKMVKRVYGVYPIVFYIALFNPITYSLTKVFSGGLWQYYARLYSMLPLPYTLGLGTVLLVGNLTKHKKAKRRSLDEKRILRSKIIKSIIVPSVFALIIFGGTDVYSQDWMKHAENIEKVPNEALWICSALHEDEDITIAVPNSLSSYIRQIDASVYMPYGRRVNFLGEALSQDNPDPIYVMEEAGREACDYIVIYNNPENKERFYSAGYEPKYTIGKYLVYTVEGVARKKNIYDQRHYLIEEKYYDEKGNPTIHGSGYSSVRYDYGQDGKCVLTTYLNETGEPTDLDGYASIKRSYTKFARQVASQSYLDVKGTPIHIFGRVETRYGYDGNKRPVREVYYDDHAQPIERTDLHYASKEIFYNEDGRITGERYYNISGEPTVCPLGYASFQRVFGSDGKIIGENYYDNKRMPIGSVSAEGNINSEGNIFSFLRCSEGVSISNDRKITFESYKRANQFDIMYFYINDAVTGEYVTSFGGEEHTGEVTGTYHHENPTGLYLLRLKGNSNVADEWIECLVYLREYDSIDYRFEINHFSKERIEISDLTASIR